MHLRDLFDKKEKIVVGLMSGTSADGIDAAVCKIVGTGTSTTTDLLAFHVHPYPSGVQEEILACSRADDGQVDRICRLNFLLGELFAEAALAAISEAGLTPQDVDLIGSHGQTIHHLPERHEAFGRSVSATMQIGEPSVIAKRTGIVTVADFRPADVAVGGEGAPLVPYFDFIVFRSENENRCVLNIGGIANVTMLPAGCSRGEVLAFDTGPGNMLVDGLMKRLYRVSFDRDGAVAAKGQCSVDLLKKVLAHPYFSKDPPKSTGREQFGDDFVEEFISAGRDLELADGDLVATATWLTATSVYEATRRFGKKTLLLHRLIISGGGAKNCRLLSMLKDRFQGVECQTTDSFGIPVDAKEAICFAVLANETVTGHAGNMPSATGADRDVVLGKICL